MTRVKPVFLFLLFLFYLFVSNQCVAQEFAPALGRGVNLSETRTYSTCVQWDKTDSFSLESEANNPSLTRLYNEVWISSREQLNTELGIDAAVSAKGLWGERSASSGASYFSKVDITSDNFYWMVDAHYQKSRKMINTGHNDFDLTARAKKILSTEGIQAFYEACGTHFYSGQNVGARYTLLYEFRSKQDRVIEQLKAGASLGKVGIGIQGSVDFQKYMEMATHSSMLRVHSHIQGGDHNLLDYATDANQLKEELRELRSQVYDHDKGVVLSWFIDNYDIFPEVIVAKKVLVAGTEFTDRFRNNVLSKLFTLFDRNKVNIALCKKMLEQSQGEDPLFLYGEEKRKLLLNQIIQYQDQNEFIHSRALVCLAGGDAVKCHADDLDPIPLDVPIPDQDLSGIEPWYLYAALPTQSYWSYWTSRTYDVHLVADHPITGEVLKFETYQKFLGDGNTLFIQTQLEDGRHERVAIGVPRMIQNPLPQIGICAGIYKEICSVRIIENPTLKTFDGTPFRKLQFTLFNALGFVIRKYDFPLTY